MRSQEAIKEDDYTLGVNALGFGGTLAVKRAEELETLKKVTPLELLKRVCMPCKEKGKSEEVKSS